MLSYLGDQEEVYGLMRVTSHRTRAYIKNADGLKGFLVASSIAHVLRPLTGTEDLKKLAEYQHIDIANVLIEIEKKESNAEMMSFLSEQYPSLFLYVSMKRCQKKEIKAYMQKNQ